MKITIREALPKEAPQLTDIAFAAKRTWKYPEEYIQIWTDELTITESYIKENIVYVAEYQKRPVGFYSIVTLPKDKKIGDISIEQGFWMDHLFIEPRYQHKGIGKQLMQHTINYCRENWIDELKVFVDPNATGFYEKQGARFVRQSPSSIQGREIPIYAFHFEEE